MYRHFDYWLSRPQSVPTTDPMTRLVTWLSARNELRRGYHDCPREIDKNIENPRLGLEHYFKVEEIMEAVSAIQSSEDKLARLSSMKRSDIKLIVDFYSEVIQQNAIMKS